MNYKLKTYVSIRLLRRPLGTLIYHYTNLYTCNLATISSKRRTDASALADPTRHSSDPRISELRNSIDDDDRE